MAPLPTGPLRSLDPIDYQKFKTHLALVIEQGLAPPTAVELLSESLYYCEAMESGLFDFAN